MWLRLRMPERWNRTGEFDRRRYRNYDAYLAHQSQKLGLLDLREYDRTYAAALKERIQDLELRGRPVLCLAARMGTEVKAFRSAGAFAVGIDLNPGKKNRYVTFGDFHHLAFADATAHLVFTNSLDHAFDVDALLGEARRVLGDGGLFVTDAVLGTSEGVSPQFYESFTWDSIDSLVARTESNGFKLRSRVAFVTPWEGEHLRFEVA